MKIRKIWMLGFSLCVAGGLAEAALPTASSRIDQVSTSQSRGSYGISWTKYNQPTWGTRWRQTLGRAPVFMSPFVRSLY
jgi:hypothetical protein